MVVIWALASLASAGKADCAKLEGDEKAVCIREATRDDLEKQIKDLGKCKADTLAEEARCLQDRAELAQRIADLYAAALEPEPERKPKAKAKAKRSNTNRMEADINEE